MNLKFNVMPKEIRCWACSPNKKNDIFDFSGIVLIDTSKTYDVFNNTKNFLVPYFNDKNYSLLKASFTTSWGSTSEITNFKVEKNSISFDYAESEASKDGNMSVSYEIIKNIDAILKDGKKSIVSQARISNIIDKNGNLIPNLEIKHLTYYDALPELTSNEFEKHLLYLNNGELKYIVGTTNNTYSSENITFKNDLVNSGGFLDWRTPTFTLNGEMYILTKNSEVFKYNSNLSKVELSIPKKITGIIEDSTITTRISAGGFYRDSIYTITFAFGAFMKEYNIISGEIKDKGVGTPRMTYPSLLFSINDTFYALGVRDSREQTEYNIYKFDDAQNKFVLVSKDSNNTELIYAASTNVNGKIYLVGAGNSFLDVCEFNYINNTITKKGTLLNAIEYSSNVTSVGNDIFISYPELRKIVKYNTLTNSVSDFETFPENTSNCVLGNLGGSLYMLYCDADGITFTSIKKATPNRTYKWKKITSVDA